MTEALARLAVDLTANVAGFESDLGRANREAQKFGRSLERDFKQIGAAMAGALAAGLAGVAASVKRTVDEIDAIGDKAKKLNITTEALTGLGYAAQQSGSSAETLEKGLRKLELQLAAAASGSEAQVQLFKDLGVSATDSAGKIRPVDKVFLDLADRFKSYKDGAGEAQIATKLFGKAGTDLLVLVNEGSDGIRALTDEAARFGVVIGETTTKQAQQFNDNLDKLRTIAQGAANELTAQLLPAMVELSQKAIDNADKAGKVGDRFSWLSGVLKGTAFGLIVVKNTVEATAIAWGTLVNQIVIGGKQIGAAFGFVAKAVEANASFDLPLTKLQNIRKAYEDFRNQAKENEKQIRLGLGAGLHGLNEQLADVKSAFDAIYNPAKQAGAAIEDTGNQSGKTEPKLTKLGQSSADTGKDLEKLAESLAKTKAEQKQWADRLRETEAILRGPMAQANLALDRQLDELGQALAEGKITREQYNAEVARQIELHKREAAQIRATRTPVQQMIDDLEFELSLLKLSNTERETAIALRQLDGKATEEQAARIRELLKNIEIGTIAKQQSDEYLAIWDRALQQLGTSIIDAFKKGGGSIGDRLGDALKESIGSALNELAQGSLKKIAISLQNAVARRTGGPQQAGGGFGWTDAANIVGSIGLSYVGGTNQGLSIAGGAAAGAAYGASIGSVIPVIGTVVGAVVGAIIGAIVGAVAAQKPRLQVSSTAGGITAGKVEGRAVSRLGSIYVGKEDFDFNAQEFADQIKQFDNALASLLNGGELENARDALRNFRVSQSRGGVNPEEILRQRFDAVIRAVKPEWEAFLDSFGELEDRVKQFEGLRNLVKQVDALDLTIQSLDPDSLNQVRFALHNLNQAVEDTADALQTAFSDKDAVAINESSQALQQAILRRYQAEVEMVRALQAQIDEASESARNFGIAMAERLAGVGADVSVAATIESGLQALRDAVGTAPNTAAAINNLDRFLQALDQWLAAARSEVEAAANEARNRVQTQLAALDSEQSALLSEAQRRASEAQAAAQAAAAAQQAAIQAQLQALQEQLAIAQQWVGVLNQARSFLDQLTFTASNPLPAGARLGAFDQRVADLRAQLETATGGQRAQIAQELLQALQGRLSLAQEQFQRPTQAYLDVFNETARETARLRDIAAAEAARAEQIQAEMAALQAATAEGVGAINDTLYYLSNEERTRLGQIEVERAALQQELIDIDAEMQAQLEDLNATARAQYEWAQQQGEQLQATRHAELLAQLNEITGGLSADAYLAQRLDETTDLLTQIRDGIAAFLEAVAAGTANTTNPAAGGNGGSGVTPVGGGGGGSLPPDFLPPRPAGEVTNQPVQIVLDGRVIGETSIQYLAANASRIAPVLRREAKVA